jgi:hypothetical protein
MDTNANPAAKRELLWLAGPAPFRSVENDPDGEVIGKGFEAVHLASGDEDERAGLNFVPVCAVEEQSLAAHDEISFVPLVGVLRVMAFWSIEFDEERASGEDGHSEISGWGRALGEGFGEAQVEDGWGCFHFLFMSFRS